MGETLIRILSIRAVWPGALALTLVSCGGQSAIRADVSARVELPAKRFIDVRLRLHRDHARHADRYLRAAASAVKLCDSWLGAFDRERVELVDDGSRGSDTAPHDVLGLDRVPLWTTTTSMGAELAAARSISRMCWSVVDARALPPWFVEGLAEYTARRAVAPLFEAENNPPGFAFLETSYFAGFIPQFVRIRLLAESDGDPIPAYRRRRRTRMDADSPPPGDREALTGKTVLALGTLERWLGRPVLDQVVAEFVQAAKARTLGLADFEHVASAASGQQLSWFFEETFRSTNRFDYGVDRLTSDADGSGAFMTTVTAHRYGEAMFTGSGAPRVGPFESGRAIVVGINFADGEQRLDHWDGRDREKTFVYRSSSRAVSAIVDPGRVLLLDLERTNNSVTLAPKRNAAATRWAGVYLLWIEYLLLTYASLA